MSSFASKSIAPLSVSSSAPIGLALALLLFGCSESTTPLADGGIAFDATGVPDAAIDAAPGSDIGLACRASGDCSSLCIDTYPGGYCSAICTSSADCPTGSSCVSVSRSESYCFDDCDPLAAARECRPGYGCADDPRIGATVCMPGCTDDSDCPGAACDPAGGFVGEGACYAPSSSVGDPCVLDEECPMSGVCLSEEWAGWPSGGCVTYGCDPDANAGCPADSHCFPNRGGGLCIDACSLDADCRDGFVCAASSSFPDRSTCRPGCTSDAQCSEGRVCNPGTGICDVPFDAAEIGDPCLSRGACAGGSCMTEYMDGFPDSYCVYEGCDPAAADASDGCPGTGVCVQRGASTYCVSTCAIASDCRAGYACESVDPSRADRGMACLPACTSDAVCTLDGSGGWPDYSCNLGTGLCDYPFEIPNLGQACQGVGECPGGACLTEGAMGWPAGTCAALGCDPAGVGPEQPCPTAGVCVADPRDGWSGGVCLSACSVLSSGCRPGYACVELAPGATDGACRPACADDGACAAGRSCDPVTGLCG